jgi:Fe-Mn family superoxide dismutase
MAPNGGGAPTGAVADKIAADFGSYDKFREEFTAAATTQFGSGWAWLVLDAGKLKIVKTGNAETPITKGQIPILTIDVWEHAYYIDYRNRRPDFIATYLDKLVNWKFANENLVRGDIFKSA